MKFLFAMVLSLIALNLVWGQDGLSSDPEIRKAQIAVYRESHTREGKQYDASIGKEFQQKYASVVHDCGKQTKDRTPFTIYAEVAEDGHVENALLDPATPIDTCVQKIMLKDAFSRPPKAGYWVQITVELRK